MDLDPHELIELTVLLLVRHETKTLVAGELPFTGISFASGVASAIASASVPEDNQEERGIRECL